MRTRLKRFYSVFTLVSRIPLRYHGQPDYSRADFYLPIVGVAAGLVAYAAYALAHFAFMGPVPPALAAIAAQYLAFNLFHFDGLLDTADALLPFASKEKRLEILKDPRSGTYAVFAGSLVILARIGALSEPGIVMGAALFGAPVVGRTAAAVVALAARPAKPDGLGSLMKGFRFYETTIGFIVAMIPSAAFGFFSGRSYLAAAIAGTSALVAVTVGIGTAHGYKRKIGGYTGDAFGAAVEIGEVAFLLAVAAVGNYI